jgi:hypothetical protein
MVDMSTIMGRRCGDVDRAGGDQEAKFLAESFPVAFRMERAAIKPAWTLVGINVVNVRRQTKKGPPCPSKSS